MTAKAAGAPSAVEQSTLTLTRSQQVYLIQGALAALEGLCLALGEVEGPRRESAAALIEWPRLAPLMGILCQITHSERGVFADVEAPD